METPRVPIRDVVMRFAEVIDEVGRRLHVGCIMAAGQNWVEVSLPEHAELASHIEVRFLPSRLSHAVTPVWRRKDRVGLTYLGGGPPEEQFAGRAGPPPAPGKPRR